MRDKVYNAQIISISGLNLSRTSAHFMVLEKMMLSYVTSVTDRHWTHVCTGLSRALPGNEKHLVPEPQRASHETMERGISGSLEDSLPLICGP